MSWPKRDWVRHGIGNGHRRLPSSDFIASHRGVDPLVTSSRLCPTGQIADNESRACAFSHTTTFVKRSLTHKRATANRLWRYRTERQFSQRHIARLLGHPTGTQVSRWETGQKIPTLDNALRLACVLETPVESLFADRVAELRARLSTRTGKRDDA